MRKIDLNNKVFRLVSSTGSGEVDIEVLFTYYQKEDVLWAEYEGGPVRKGTVTGRIREDGTLDFHYQHLNTENEVMTGHCLSTIEKLPNGKLRLHETWSWTNGDLSSGTSIVEEI